ncbi:TraM recognition domain-containing protein, partial [Candidatus Dojkabacteria bacterium]|nr:TraM recognition domain-containing protein [Candidatus Dojkabacteria bacterium]
ISFEVVAFKENIKFFVVCPKNVASVVDRQINGTYPSAEIVRVKEYNAFPENASVSYAGLKLKQESRIPIQTYEELPVDTLATLTDAFSKLSFNESALFQVIISPAGSDWRNSAKDYIKKIKDQKADSEKDDPKVNEDTLGFIEKKAGKSGFYTDVRLVIMSHDKEDADAHLSNALSTFDQYTKEGGNSFSKMDKKETKRIVTDVIYRIPRETMVLNVEELATLFHFPNKNVEAPFINWLLSRKAPAPDYVTNAFQKDYMYLGKNSFRGKSKEIFMLPQDRMRHMYVVGQTGSGKSGFIAGMMIRDIKMGHGCAFIDPHGSDIEKILQQIPPERVDDVVLFDPADIERPAGLNMFEFKSDAQKTLAINEMLNIFNTLYDLQKTGGPMFEQYFRYGIMLLISDPESGSTLLEVPKIFADDDYRAYKLSKCDNQEVVDFWEKQAQKAGGETSLKNVTPYVVSKLASFLTNEYVRPIVAQQESSINFRQIMDEGKILLVKLSKGKIGEFNMSLLGMIIVSKLLISALEREDVPEEQRKPFYLYIDEFQNFLTDGVNQILSEARKYQLSLTLAHQFIGQLTRQGGDTKIRDSIFGNVGNKAILRVGVNDAEFLEKEFDGVFGQADLMQAENGTIFTKMLVDGKPSTPFTVRSWYGESPYDMITTPNPQLAQTIKQISRLKYGKDRALIEDEIKLRGKFIKKVEKPAGGNNMFGGLGNFNIGN